MTNYRDEDNPYPKKCDDCELYSFVGSHCMANTPCPHEVYEAGYDAGEKSREFTEEEKGVIKGLELLARARAIHLEPAFYSLAKKVLGEE